MSEIISRGNLNQILIRMITDPPASLSWCTALPPRRHLRYCSSPPLHSQPLHHQPPHCPPLRKAHKLWRLVRLGWWTLTYLSDTALSLEIHLVVSSLQESQLRKKLLQSVLQGLRFCPIWTKTYLEGVKQVLALFAPPTLLAKHPSLEKHNQCRSFNTNHPYYLFPMRQRDCTAPAVCGHRNCQKKSLVRIADISPIEQPEILSCHLSLV